MIFTFKKFRLIGARARIKKLLYMVEDAIPGLNTPQAMQHLPTYLAYTIQLNTEERKYQFNAAELEQLATYQAQLSQWTSDSVVAHHPLSPQDKEQISKILLRVRQLLLDKIQAPIRESSLIILDRDATACEPLVWPCELVVVLDHLRSPFNVGAILRTMECVGLHRLISVGYTPRLDSRQVQRSAMGCETAMNVAYVSDVVEAAQGLQTQGFQIYVLETIQPSQSVFQLDGERLKASKIAFVVGNEEIGVDEALIAMADHRLHIPTFGKKNSLNVSIAFSIAIYQFWSVLLGGTPYETV